MEPSSLLHPIARTNEIFLLINRLRSPWGMSGKDMNRLRELHPTKIEVEEACPWL